MPHQKGTASDYRNLLLKVDDFITNKHIATAVVNAGGTGYVVGDIITVAGGTVVNSMPATLEVTAVSGGVITALHINSSGAYSAAPTISGNAVTGGTGSGATVDLTIMSPQWVNRIKNIATATGPIEVGSVSIGADGSGYTVSDVVTLDAPLVNTAQMTATVSTISGSGDVLGISLTTKGDYNSFASGNFSTTGGTGTGLSLDPDFIPTRDEYMWEGDGTGGNNVFVGMRSSYSPGIDQQSVQLAGFTSWDTTNNWDNQTGMSPGEDSLSAGKGSYILASSNPFDFWVYATARRIIVVINVAGNYQSAYLGLLDPFGTDTEIPYPMFICGSSDKNKEDIGNSSLWVRGPADPTSSTSLTTNGPGYVRLGASYNKTWNGSYSGSSIGSNKHQSLFVYPTATVYTSGLLSDDLLSSVSSGNYLWQHTIRSDKDSTPSKRFMPSPDSGGNIYFPIQCVVIQSRQGIAHRAIGEINGMFWVSAEDGLIAQDKIIVGGVSYRVFQMGANSLSYAHFCVRED